MLVTAGTETAGHQKTVLVPLLFALISEDSLNFFDGLILHHEAGRR